MPKPQEYGKELADQWLDWVEDATDNEHDLAQELRDGTITDGELAEMREAFVARMREIMTKVIAGARQEITED